MNRTKSIYKNKLKRSKKTQAELKSNIPKSELWFLNEISSRNIEIPYLKHNELFRLYIPDFISIPLKVIIEIDGSIHENEDQKERDKKKDIYYRNNGFEVIRVIAYDENSLIECFSKILTILTEYRKSSVIRKPKKVTKRIDTLCYTCQTYKSKHLLEISGIHRKFCGYCIGNAQLKINK